MLRRGALTLILTMLVAACGGGADSGPADRPGNVASFPATGDERATVATLALAGSGGACSARWDGQPVTPAQILERSSAAVGQSIESAGGIANLTGETLPVVAVTAPAALAFACADSALAPVRRAGVPTVLLSVEGGGQAALADFTLSDIGAPPPSVVLAVGAGGRVTWNGEAIGLDVLPERVRQLSGAGAAEMEAPPGELEVRPAREATFGQLHAVLRAVREGRIRAALLLPSVPPNRRPVAPPPRTAPTNEAAPRP